MSDQNTSQSNGELRKLGKRITELNYKCTQVLMFLSFAIAATALLWTKDHNGLFVRPLRLWVGAVFPTVVGILPLKEACEDNVCWYRIIRWFKVLLLSAAIVFIFWGAVDFALAL